METDMSTRRSFIASLLATASLPTLTWSDAGGPAYLAAAKEADGTYALIGLTDTGEQVFNIPLPARGHAGAGHPARPEAVAFARRPGTFALVIDCAFGQVMHHLEAPTGLHFSGHGVFSADGRTLFTSETENEGGAGRIGVWNADQGYSRTGSFASGGIGPHEILRLPNSDTLVVANGGIIAALDDERSKLNLDTMAPNLSYLTSQGALVEQVTLSASLHKNSIRHLAVAADGTVGFAMQWEGDTSETPPLLGLHKRGSEVRLVTVPDRLAPRLKNYAASIAFENSGDRIAITCPKGGVLVSFDSNGTDPIIIERRDVCGLSSAQMGLFVTDGLGGVLLVQGEEVRPLSVFGRSWDNHLIKV
jgi:hypothetical protein